jgi:cold shock CspA family protein
MSSQKNPRYQGRISAWKDDQGFGFITPNGGGPTVFVHIKSFVRQGIRPSGNEIVTYDLTVNEKGQPRAENVAYVHNRYAK